MIKKQLNIKYVFANIEIKSNHSNHFWSLNKSNRMVSLKNSTMIIPFRTKLVARCLFKNINPL